MSTDLDLVLELADLAATLSVPRFESGDFTVQIKPDGSPVTDVDVAVERLLRARLAEARPDDAILGEEFGATGAGSRRWYLDPIDGTSWFVDRVPRWATLIAVADGETLLAAVMDLPMRGERWWASRGGGAFRNGAELRVSARAPLADAIVAEDLRGPLEQLPARHPLVQIAGRAASVDSGDRDGILAVIAGEADVAVATHGYEWDYAPYCLLLSEAGGRFTDLKGEARIDGHTALASNGLVHDEVLAVLRAARSTDATMGGGSHVGREGA
jgi:histidinol-phosphatase